MQTPAAVLLISALFVVPCFPQTTPASTFSSEALHLTFTYPANLKALPGTAAESLDQARSEAGTDNLKKSYGCISMPFMAAEDSTTSALIVIRLDLECMKVPPPLARVLGPIAQNALKEGLGKLGQPSLGPVLPYKIDNHEASFLRGSATDEDGKLAYAAASCVLIDKSAVCWEALSKVKATMESMIEVPINLDGHAAQPLVPADLLMK